MKNRPEPSKASQIFPEPTKTTQSLPKKASRRLGGGAKPERAKHPKCSAHQNCKDFQSKAYAFKHVSGQSYRWTHAGPSGVENATPSLEMHPTPVPVVENATPSLEMQPKMQPLRQKLARSRPKMQPLRQKWHRHVLFGGRKCNPFAWNAAEHATPSVEFGKASAKNATPTPEIASACVVSSIQQAFNQIQKCNPCTRNAVENATPSPEIAIGHIKHATSIHSC